MTAVICSIAQVTRLNRGLSAWYLLSAAIILVATGLAKLWSAFGSVRLLVVADPIAGIPFRGCYWRWAGWNWPSLACVFQPAPAAGHAAGGVAGHELPGVSAGAVVDGVAQAVRVHGQPHQRPAPLGAGGGQHHERRAGVSAPWQLRATGLAMAAAARGAGEAGQWRIEDGVDREVSVEHNAANRI